MVLRHTSCWTAKCDQWLLVTQNSHGMRGIGTMLAAIYILLLNGIQSQLQALMSSYVSFLTAKHASTAGKDTKHC